MSQLIRKSHNVSILLYHIVCPAKYRRVVITDEVDRIARLIDRMQQLGGSTREELAPTNLHESIRSALATVRAGGTDGVELVEEFDPSLPPVLANRDALEQVVMNLAVNSQDAMIDGGIISIGSIRNIKLNLYH